jgi:hypothetical protein
VRARARAYVRVRVVVVVVCVCYVNRGCEGFSSSCSVSVCVVVGGEG